MNIHQTAEVSENSVIGEKTNIWHHSQVRENTQIGENCNIGKNVYIDINVKIGNNVKIQNNVSIYDGVTIEDDVFIGPSVTFTNDLYPRAFIWEEGKERETILVKKGASIGANSTIICGNRIIGKYALVGAGSVITRNVPDHGLVFGNPAKLIGFVCDCAQKLDNTKYTSDSDNIILKCSKCNKEININKSDFNLLRRKENE